MSVSSSEFYCMSCGEDDTNLYYDCKFDPARCAACYFLCNQCGNEWRKQKCECQELVEDVLIIDSAPAAGSEGT